jgi:hypothetical protein
MARSAPRQPALLLRLDDPSRENAPDARHGVLRNLDERESGAGAVDHLHVPIARDPIQIAARREIAGGIAEHEAGHRLEHAKALTAEPESLGRRARAEEVEHGGGAGTISGHRE